MSRVSTFSIMAAVLVAASGIAAAADLEGGPTIEKPACAEGECPKFVSGKPTSPITLSAAIAQSQAFASQDSAFTSLSSAPIFRGDTACEEGKCPQFTSGALKDPTHQIDGVTLR